MPRSGNGNYNPPLNSWNPAINGTQALPNDWMAILNDISAGIQGSVAADGQTPITGVINHNSYRIAGLGAPNGEGDALRFEQLGKGADIASAATITIPNEGQLFTVTGTTSITAINDAYNGRFAFLTFEDVVTLTNSASLILPQGKNIVTAAGDVIGFMNTAAGVWVAVARTKTTASGISVTPVGNIAATDVQAALVELDTEKVAKAGDSMTGTLGINSNSANTGLALRTAAGVVRALFYRPSFAPASIAVYNSSGGFLNEFSFHEDGTFHCGNAIMYSDGNLNGSTWGGLLSTYLSNTYATKRAQCVRDSGTVEFGYVGALASEPTATLDITAPYVMTGLRHANGLSGIYVRGATLRNMA